jgi:hypothetical protein
MAAYGRVFAGALKRAGWRVLAMRFVFWVMFFLAIFFFDVFC